MNEDYKASSFWSRDIFMAEYHKLITIIAFLNVDIWDIGKVSVLLKNSSFNVSNLKMKII